MHKKSGYILILTLSIISLSVALVTYMVSSGRAFVPLAQSAIEREKARMLAFSGIEIVKSQLGTLPYMATDTKKKQEKQDAKTDSLFSFLLPRMGRWQKFSLSKKYDGIQGEIGICMMSEEGKINLNALFDPKTGTLHKNLEGKDAITAFFALLEKITGIKDVQKELEQFFKQRKTLLDDVTELLTIPSYAYFKQDIFYDPSFDETSPEMKKKIYLTDIFTIWSPTYKIQPWLLSSSMRVLLNLAPIHAYQEKDLERIVKEQLQQTPATLSWPQDWNTYLKLIFKNDFSILPKGIELIFDTKFEPTIFSVICYGKVGKTTQKLFAILERVKDETQQDTPHWSMSIKKLYWI